MARAHARAVGRAACAPLTAVDSCWQRWCFCRSATVRSASPLIVTRSASHCRTAAPANRGRKRRSWGDGDGRTAALSRYPWSRPSLVWQQALPARSVFVRPTAEIQLLAPARAQRGRSIVSCNFWLCGPILGFTSTFRRGPPVVEEVLTGAPNRHNQCLTQSRPDELSQLPSTRR